METRANGISEDGEPARRGPERPASAGAEIRTFLIADVRDYTRFTQERGDDAAASLAAAFAELAREVIEACGGDLLELRGDEALAVFGSARQAIRAAVELQTRFRSADTPFPLGIGIGLDAGEAVPVAGGFRGGALNLAARLCSIAGPGEILASETVTSLARHIDGIRFAERRAVRLKGLERPVRVNEVAPVSPLPPLPTAPKQRTLVSRPVAFLALGLALIAASLLAYALTRDSEGLPRLEENTVGLVDTNANRLVAQVPLGSPADSIVAGAGSVWVSNALNGTVSRIEPKTYDLRTIDVGGRPAGLAFGAGSLWIANSESREVAQIDPKSARVVQTIAVGNGPRAVAVGFGAVWVANSLDGTVSRIDLERTQEAKVIFVGGSPVALAVSGDAVWVASEASGVVTRIAGESGEVVTPIEVGSGPSAVAVGEGAVWVANRQDATVSRIDPATNSVKAAIPVGPRPVALVADEGTVWVAESGGGTLSRIDVAGGRVEDTVSLTASPAGLALLNGGLWTTALAPLDSHRGGTLRVESAPLDFFDPGASYSVEGWRVLGLVYDGLVGYRRVGGAAGATLVANLATHVPTPTDGGRTYTFQLRPGIRYSNGAPVRPEDLPSSLERVFKMSPSPGQLFQGIVGGAACLKEPAGCDLSRGIEIDEGARTATIHLTAPDQDFLYKLALPLASLVPAGSPPGPVDEEPLPGTGPYRLEAVEGGGQTIRLVRNPHFRVWSSDARPDGYPDEIVIRTGGEADQPVAAVVDGEADWAEVPDERIRTLGTARPSQLHSDPLLSTYFMFLNVRVPPFDDVRVRRALNLATDRGRLVELLGGPLRAQPTCQIVAPNVFGYQPHCAYTVDPSPAGTWIAPDVARASQLVAASGTREMKVIVSTFSGQESIGRYFTSLLRRLGYASSLRVLDDEKYFSTVADSSARVQIGPIAWFADLPAASNFVAHLFSCESFIPARPENLNYSEFCDRRVDAAVEAARRAQALDPRAGGELWAAADRAVMDAAPAVPFANLRAVALVSERVGNYQYHPLSGTLLDQLWVN
jgi:YVTN family beta-propeller protein